MERILRATNYPYLYGLGLYGVSVEQAISLTGRLFHFSYVNSESVRKNTAFTPVLKNQISSLFIDISKGKKISEINDNKTIFKHIFTMLTNLQHLNFGPSLMYHQRFSFNTPSPNVISSNLLELHITVFSFIDVLYLLDGRFNQLRTFHVKVHHIHSRSSNIDSEEKLPNLRCFSLSSDMRVHFYDESILPLLHRMLNLEKLDLNVRLHHYKGFIDGNDLKKDIINYMPRLNKFTFNIRVINNFPNQMNFPSNEDIQCTFNDFKDDQIVSCVNLFQENHYNYCHIYTCPYRMKYYDIITNNFPGGLFNYVYKVSLFDEHPFEYDFFRQIARSFPFMKKLTVTNNKPQKNKLYKKIKERQSRFINY
ncbi:unnamed protein product [Rotaria sp. Silwood2]|nr:unnamed protein product [Rotaria sp. Silwood2]CAF4012280.1 unnamed protein product [Rotaria sp. Silwood2]